MCNPHDVIPRDYDIIAPPTGDGSGEDSGGVQVSEGGGGGGVSEVISRHKHSLHGGDGAFLGGSDSLLHGAHVSGQGWLVAHGRWDTTQQS